MRLFRAGERHSGVEFSLEVFTGPGFVEQIADGGPDVWGLRVVSPEAGSQTHWHSHSGGQLLYVIEGRGYIQNRGEVEIHRLDPGDLVVAEPNEVHWHGAGPSRSVKHLALSFGEHVYQEPPAIEFPADA